MAKAKKAFDLSEFITDSLSIQVNATSPTRSMVKRPYKDPFEDFINQDPLELIGENSFGKPVEVPLSTIGTPIQEFYRGTNVFITGGTGFVGKILTEKLVRSLPHLGQIYLLIREKRGKSFSERIDQLLDDKVFLRMKTEVPHYRKKITAVEGDISKPGLGLSAADRQMLIDSVHVIFNSAADVRFTEPLRSALESNVSGSKRVLDLAKEIKDLKVFIHVSTAYSQCVHKTIKENVPKVGLSYKEIFEFVNSRNDQELQRDIGKIMLGWPNTYTFSKAVCEDMLQEEAGGVPLCIFRPCVVIASYREPVRGWTDNLHGPVGLHVGVGHGVIHCFKMKLDLTIDLVPVDYTVNCMIAASWSLATHRSSNEPLPVYNFTTSPKKKPFWKSTVENSMALKDTAPFNNAIYYTSFFTTTNEYVLLFCSYTLQKIPGIIVDKLAELAGNPFRLSRVFARIDSLRDSVEYFSVRNVWHFEQDNVWRLWDRLEEKDKRMFHFDDSDIDDREKIYLSKIGLKHYYFKENLKDMKAAQRKNTWLYWIHMTVKSVGYLLALKLLVVTARVLPL